jgi:hypothetical protein
MALPASGRRGGRPSVVTNEERLAAYREALAAATTLDEVLATAAPALRAGPPVRSRARGVSQMIAGSIARPELAPETLSRMQPWLELCEETLERVLGDSPLLQVLPSSELAYSIVTFYLGANVLTHLEGDRTRADAVIQRLRLLEPLASRLLTS